MKREMRMEVMLWVEIRTGPTSKIEQVRRRTGSRGSSHSWPAARYCWAVDKVVSEIRVRVVDAEQKPYLHRVKRHVHDVHSNEHAMDLSDTRNSYMAARCSHEVDRSYRRVNSGVSAKSRKATHHHEVRVR